MKKNEKQIQPVTVEQLSEQVRTHLDCADPFDEGYTRALNNLKTLDSMKKKTLREKIDPNVVIGGVSSLAGIGMILKYERFGVIATKALGLVSKIRF